MWNLDRKIGYGVRLRELLAVFLFYFFFSWLYRIVLWYSGRGFEDEGLWGWTNLRGYWSAAGFQYLWYFVASLIIWFLGVYLLKKKSRAWQITTVLILIPMIVYVVRELRYEVVDFYELGRLTGTGTVWDWYIPLLFMMFQFGCFFAYRYFQENQQKLLIEGELRQAALKSELSALKAQLNPHFLYNVFNTINASLPPERENTRRLIATLSDLFRYQLKASREELVPLHEELDFVQKYLELEKARFEDRLQVTIEVPEEILDEEIPPMLLQPIVENSVKHGLSSLIEGGTIQISIFKNANKLKFEISDTGIGIPDKQNVFQKGVGLNNTRARLWKMYQSRLELSDNIPRGLKVEFAL